MATRQQERAQTAYARVSPRVRGEGEAEYLRFAKSFPALIQSCGLAQALGFAAAKAPDGYLEDLAQVMAAGNREDLARQAREAEVPAYQRISRDSLAAATWVKRYAEALLKGDE